MNLESMGKENYRNMKPDKNVGKLFKNVSKKDIIDLVFSFTRNKKQSEKVQKDRDFAKKILEKFTYDFAIIEYSRTSFHENEIGVSGSHLYNGGVQKGVYISRTIHWLNKNKFDKQPVKFMITKNEKELKE